MPTCTPYRILCMSMLCKLDLKNDMLLKITVKMLSGACSTSLNHHTKLHHILWEKRITNDTSTEFCVCKTIATNTHATLVNMEQCYIYYKHKVPGVKSSCVSNSRFMVGKEYTCKQYNNKWIDLFNSILLFIQN